MDPDARRTLERTIWRDRIRSAAWVALLLSPLVAGLAWYTLPPVPAGVLLAEVTGFETRASDDEVPVRLRVSLPDGTGISLRPGPGAAAIAPGTTICLARLLHPISDAPRYLPVDMGRCETDG